MKKKANTTPSHTLSPLLNKHLSSPTTTQPSIIRPPSLHNLQPITLLPPFPPLISLLTTTPPRSLPSSDTPSRDRYAGDTDLDEHHKVYITHVSTHLTTPSSARLSLPPSKALPWNSSTPSPHTQLTALTPSPTFSPPILSVVAHIRPHPYPSSTSDKKETRCCGPLSTALARPPSACPTSLKSDVVVYGPNFETCSIC